jgi:hypothetical protein
MRKRFYFVLLVLALILLAVPGFAAKAAKRISGQAALAGTPSAR